jgi:hypothetical protein
MALVKLQICCVVVSWGKLSREDTGDGAAGLRVGTYDKYEIEAVADVRHGNGRDLALE